MPLTSLASRCRPLDTWRQAHSCLSLHRSVQYIVNAHEYACTFSVQLQEACLTLYFSHALVTKAAPRVLESERKSGQINASPRRRRLRTPQAARRRSAPYARWSRTTIISTTAPWPASAAEPSSGAPTTAGPIVLAPTTCASARGDVISLARTERSVKSAATTGV